MGDVIADPGAQAGFEIMEYHEKARAIKKALDTLPQLERQAVAARYCQGLTLEQTAKRLGMGQAETERMVRKGLKRLRHPSVSGGLRPFFP